MRKIYELDFDFSNNIPDFEFKVTKNIHDFFSDEEIYSFLKKEGYIEKIINKYKNGELEFSDLSLIQIYRDKYGSFKGLEPYIKLQIDGKKSNMGDIMRVAGFETEFLLSKKAKNYFEKKYPEKFGYIEIFYEKIPLYIITSIVDTEYCYDMRIHSRKFDVFNFSKIKGENDIFKIGTTTNSGFLLNRPYCNEKFKLYLEASDLKGYQFIEVMDVAEALNMEQEKKEEREPSFPEIEEKRYYDNGLLEWEGILWKGFRVKDWKFYHENGNLSMEGEYDQEGEAKGEWKYYHSNGNLKGIGQYAQGKKTGIFQNYEEEKGYLLSEADYTGKTKEDLIFWRFYYEDGSLQKEGTAREIGNNEDWEITGEWRYYSPRGELIKREVFEKNALIEEE